MKKLLVIWPILILLFSVLVFASFNLIEEQLASNDHSTFCVTSGDRCQQITPPYAIRNLTFGIYFNDATPITSGNCWVRVHEGNSTHIGDFVMDSEENRSCSTLYSSAAFNWTFDDNTVLEGNQMYWICAEGDPNPYTRVVYYWSGCAYPGGVAIEEDSTQVGGGSACTKFQYWGNNDTGSVPVLSNYNVTSAYQNATAWNENKSFPIPTWDTTPTVRFDTDVNAYCRISSSDGVGDKNYTNMLSNIRNCTSGEGGKNHICSLKPEDELITSSEYLYISCKSTSGQQSTNSSSGALKLEVCDIEINSSKALDYGIQSSEIWPNATVYNDQQIYIVNTSYQKTGAVERVAVYGNKRWIFNLYNSNPLGLFNLSPAVYVLEIALETLSLSEIRNLVSGYINDTYP